MSFSCRQQDAQCDVIHREEEEKDTHTQRVGTERERNGEGISLEERFELRMGKEREKGPLHVRTHTAVLHPLIQYADAIIFLLLFNSLLVFGCTLC